MPPAATPARPSSEDQAAAPAERPSRPRAASRRKTEKRVKPRSSNWRFRTGGVLLGIVFPFLAASLAYPQWTGALGHWIERILFLNLGMASMLLPLIVLGLGLRLTLPKLVTPLQLTWAPWLMLADLVLLAHCMGRQGGQVGAFLASVSDAVVGSVGTWILALLGLGLLGMALLRIPLSSAAHLATEFAHGAAALAGTLLQRVREDFSLVDPESLEDLTPAPATATPKPAAVKPAAVVAPPPPEPPVAWNSQELESWEQAVEEGEASEEEPSAAEELDEEEEWEEDEEESSDPFSGSAEPEEATAPPSAEPAALPPSVEPVATPVETPAVRPASPLPPVCADGVLEDPDGQLRLFPGPAAAPAVRYKLPPLSLLDEAPPGLAKRPLEDKSQILLDALQSFGVQASMLQIVRGPAVTRYELQPARGVKVARFTSLTNDIALALAATGVRIEAPIPGKSAIGIEIPNEHTDLVVLREILGSPRFRKSAGLSIALGKDLSGNPWFANLQKMPHLLVAGTTGSGKSVCVNGLILSLLYRFTPRQLQILMVDPKQVELSVYEGIPHLIGMAGGLPGQIICDPKRAALALHQVVELMEQRYTQFAGLRVRNLEEYNAAAEEPLPWVVVIIDELADLMMVAAKTVETSICRIAQKARAAGIHLVLATQRPSADVITGLIKVNVPSRVAFAVSSQVDSRVILDTGGAEQLLGKGDMLFLPVDASDPKRLQGAYVTNEEILRVVEFWKAQSCPENLIELQMGEVVEDAGDDDDGDEDDQLCEQALQVVLRRQQASASLLQTELKVGYARARRILILLEKKGYIGPADGSKPRKILYGSA